MISITQHSKIKKGIVIFLIFIFLAQVFLPTVAYAFVGGGPNQPEVQSFTPAGTSQMVDPFTGNFSYNIPLMDVGGYPLNISYQSGITMDQEASWVGLGWNINPGAINRSMRGLPDDFNGTDMVKKEYNLADNWTLGIGALGDLKLIGLPALGVNLSFGFGKGAFYNSYKGLGTTKEMNIGVSLTNSPKLGGASFRISDNSQKEGIDIDAGLTIGRSISNPSDRLSPFSGKIGASFNTVQGLKALTLGADAFGASRRVGTDRVPSGTGVGLGTSGSIPFSPYSYTPEINMPMQSTSIDLRVGGGGHFFWIFPHGAINGYFNTEQLNGNKQILPAYGYLNADLGKDNLYALHDFNREKDASYSENTPALPLTNFMYDVYSVSGQGVSGIYRPYRNDKGVVYDHAVHSSGVAAQFGLELGGGNLVHVGVNEGVYVSDDHSNRWDNKAQGQLGFKTKEDESVSPQYEPYYFKAAGEMTAINSSYYNEVGGDDPIRVNINDGKPENIGPFIRTISREPGKEEPLDINGQPQVDRAKRNQVISILTAKEATLSGAEKEIKSYTFNDPAKGTNDTAFYSRFSQNGPAREHHISEISVYRPDGSRYIYGIPTYSLKQKEVTFNVGDGNVHDYSKGDVTYAAGTDNSSANGKGSDHYFSSTELPPFSNSYLLTEVLSADYVDLTLDGPTDDDLGSYTKFNYTKFGGGGSGTFKWRTPFNNASYNEGLKSDLNDDKASYIYGENELWYLHSIETKTHIAEFTLSNREDGYGVIDENGGIASSSPIVKQKIDKITLYAKHDRQVNKEKAVPIQTTYFDYDYSLCPGISYNKTGGGKLTLKRIYSTFKNIPKGKLSYYEFNYDGLNPSYNLKGYDRWGNYKPNKTKKDYDVTQDTLSNSDFPYVNQDKTQADNYVSAWNLTSIKLPSGGGINITYESDDYAFVQDKRAMQMAFVTGLGNNQNDINSNHLWDVDNSSGQAVKRSNLYAKLKLPVSVANKEDFAKKYMNEIDGKPMEHLYFKFLVDLHNTGNSYDFVTGYADISDVGVYGAQDANGNYGEAWIKLNDVDDEHPISKAGEQLVRFSARNKEVKNQPDKSVTGVLNSIAGVLNAIGPDIDLPPAPPQTILTDNKSMCRLYNPNYMKLGGGSRVNKISMSDKWSEMGGSSSSDDFEYGEEYTYTKTLEGSVTADNKDGITISSGVAEYEPMIGNEENPLRQPVGFSVKHLLAPDEKFYLETPFGESFYPGASVGYSRVKVNSLKHDGVKRTATGFVVQEFYTARDFPVATEQTSLQSKPDRSDFFRQLLKFGIKDNMTVSQGYVIKLNNMHGKQKAKWVYGEDQDQPVSGQQYFYKTETTDTKRLDNQVMAIHKDNRISQEVVGKEVDFIADMREHESSAFNVSLGVNYDLSILPIGPFPIPVPLFSIWPDITTTSNAFRSSVITKTITSYGILDKVVSQDLGSTVSVQNKLYDSETGEVLLTQTQNNFDDTVYNFSYPAHWGYDRMGMAYQNMGIKVKASNINFGNVTFADPNAAQFFTKGDEVIFLPDKTASAPDPLPVRLWVASVINNNVNVINQAGVAMGSSIVIGGGTPPPLSGMLTIVRPGRKNQQALSIGSVTSLSNPITGTSLSFENAKVINAGAVEYNDKGSEFCECGKDIVVVVGFAASSPTAPSNPFLQGSDGIFRIKRAYTFLTGRNQSDINRNTNLRDDGTYATFDPFWKPNAGRDWFMNNSQWTYTSEVTKFSPFGFALESKGPSPLNIYSSATYGYDNTQQTSSIYNGRYKEVGVDGFEDYGLSDCSTDHWSFKKYSSNITSLQAHTGRSSLKVDRNSTFSVEKMIVCPPPPDNNPK